MPNVPELLAPNAGINAAIAEAQAAAPTLIAAHVAANDPHGDRSYALSLIGGFTPYTKAVLEKVSCVGCWRLNEPGGSIAYDLSSGKRSGAYFGDRTQGEPALIKGDTTAACVKFEHRGGEEAGVRAETPTSAIENWTIACWCKKRVAKYPTSRHVLWEIGNGTSNGVGAEFAPSSDELKLTFNAVESGMATGVEISDLERHMVVVTRGAAKTKAFLDTVEHVLVPEPTPKAPTTYFAMGSEVNETHEFQGSMEEIAVFTTALSKAEIETLWNLGK